MKPTNAIFTGVPTTVFEVMSRLAIEHKAVNLGQGFPDVDGPEELRRIAAEATVAGPNQYPPMLGLAELREAVAAANRRFYGLDIDPASEVLVTSGATEAIADCLLGIVEPGDEVILIEPLYDCYLPMARRAGAEIKLVRVAPPDWRLDRDALEAAFSERTKAILLNNPMNPAAKVFSEDELALIAELCVKYDAYAICDEVYEHLVFDGRKHRPLMTFEGMRERSVRIGSAGKTFSFTGWKVGYISGPASLIGPVAKAHQFVTFTTPPNLQKAVAKGLASDDAYYEGFVADMTAKRDHLSDGLARLGFPVLPCEGTYFVSVDIAGMGLGEDDVAACRTLTVDAGVAAIPLSAFYPGKNAPKTFVRFCFCKRPEVLDAALDRLEAYLGRDQQASA
ncbi:aspartate/methionine/tyrosine aminotransferase [Rhodobium orientis]|uniref:Aminotransferase n=1 Tax=Rhodobium orientis TaxID=34017 RepID=A0A327JLM3_9HYPH|nr:aminotransferase [Rhodobium orientis]MBB4301958.1 aspartate/methionine/tyrosine aminotransferase [Rhodobium orientis]MBK5950195.1 aminotransferase [Rhodobium orientis]RAI27259.1 aminotransferase [Rhodobium orientis]